MLASHARICYVFASIRRYYTISNHSLSQRDRPTTTTGLKHSQDKKGDVVVLQCQCKICNDVDDEADEVCRSAASFVRKAGDHHWSQSLDDLKTVVSRHYAFRGENAYQVRRHCNGDLGARDMEISGNLISCQLRR